MIVDSSAVIAIVNDEPEAARFARQLKIAGSARISAANYLESAIVVDSTRDPITSRRLDQILLDAKVDVVPVTPEHARTAREAYRDFGKGSGHPAQLNFGDCFAYALAIDADEPLLFKGDDFGHTDVRVAVRPG